MTDTMRDVLLCFRIQAKRIACYNGSALPSNGSPVGPRTATCYGESGPLARHEQAHTQAGPAQSPRECSQWTDWLQERVHTQAGPEQPPREWSQCSVYKNGFILRQAQSSPHGSDRSGL
jgi:hypothetical protein